MREVKALLIRKYSEEQSCFFLYFWFSSVYTETISPIRWHLPFEIQPSLADDHLFRKSSRRGDTSPVYTLDSSDLDSLKFFHWSLIFYNSGKGVGEYRAY
jgi:hypothetical protein